MKVSRKAAAIIPAAIASTFSIADGSLAYSCYSELPVYISQVNVNDQIRIYRHILIPEEIQTLKRGNDFSSVTRFDIVCRRGHVERPIGCFYRFVTLSRPPDARDSALKIRDLCLKEDQLFILLDFGHAYLVVAIDYNRTSTREIGLGNICSLAVESPRIDIETLRARLVRENGIVRAEIVQRRDGGQVERIYDLQLNSRGLSATLKQEKITKE